MSNRPETQTVISLLLNQPSDEETSLRLVAVGKSGMSYDANEYPRFWSRVTGEVFRFRVEVFRSRLTQVTVIPSNCTDGGKMPSLSPYQRVRVKFYMLIKKLCILEGSCFSIVNSFLLQLLKVVLHQNQLTVPKNLSKVSTLKFVRSAT